MRRIISAIYCLFLSLGCFAQKNEIGVHLLSYSNYHFHDKYWRIGIYSDDNPPFHLLNGLTYKRQTGNKDFLKASFYYRKLTDSVNARANKYWGIDGYYTEHILKLGYERDLNTRKLTPYIGADIGLYFADYEGSSKGEYAKSLYQLSGSGFGISPIFGLKFKINKHLILSAESCADFVQLDFKHMETIHTISSKRTDLFSTRNFNARFNPLQKLSLNLKF